MEASVVHILLIEGQQQQQHHHHHHHHFSVCYDIFARFDILSKKKHQNGH